MLTMRNVVRFALAGAVMMAFVLSSGSDAVARPKYLTTLNTTYPKLVEKHGTDGKLSCAVCHPTKEKAKKFRNNYGTAVAAHLTKKNETDEAKIAEAIKATEKDASGTEGKTFGALIEAGELPGIDETVNPE